jgi:hypothetical protein
MPLSNQNGCIWIIQSKYYNQWVGNLPFAPFVYWNVITDDDTIPVCTYGYKTIKSAEKQISSYVSNIKELKVLHIETEEEHKVQFLKYVSECRENF